MAQLHENPKVYSSHQLLFDPHLLTITIFCFLIILRIASFSISCNLSSFVMRTTLLFCSVVNLPNFCTMTDSEIKLEEAAVLHYTYAKFSDLTSRRDRCGCKPTKEDVKRCFMLEFDRAVSILY